MFNRLMACVVVASSLLAPGTLLAQSEALREHLQKAAQAHEKKDWPGFLEHTQRAVEAAPKSLRARYNLACAYALNGKPAEAAAALDPILKRSVYFDLGADEDFAPIKDAPEFRAVREKFEALKAPVGASEVAFTLPEKDFAAEGLALDPKNGAFYVSSFRKRKVVVWREGRTGQAVAPAQDGLLAALGMAFDGRDRILWVGSGALPQMDGFRAEEEGRAGVFGFDALGRLQRKLLLSNNVGVKHSLGDLAVDSQGNVFASDSLAGIVYLVPARTQTIAPFVDTLVSPQGIAFPPDEKALYVADYPRGIARVDRATKAVTMLEGPDDAVLSGIDALFYVKGALVGIQNGIRPHRVVRLGLDAAGTRITDVRILAMNLPAWDEPTQGVVSGGYLYYVANSGWSAFDEEKKTWDAAKLSAPTILKLKLDW